MSFSETSYLLSERNNPNSAVRSNGFRFWGHPSRVGGLGAITCIVVHTTENDPGPGVAMNVARWQGSTAPSPSSYHVLVDTRDIVRTLRDGAVAFHAVGMNTRGLGLSFATRAHLWGRNRAVDRAMLERGAQVAAAWAHAYSIPFRWLTKDQADRGVRGFIRHSVADPARRSDPGAGFPADEFFALAQKQQEEDVIPDDQMNRLLSAIASGPAKAGRDLQSENVWGLRDSSIDNLNEQTKSRHILIHTRWLRTEGIPRILGAIEQQTQALADAIESIEVDGGGSGTGASVKLAEIAQAMREQDKAMLQASINALNKLEAESK